MTKAMGWTRNPRRLGSGLAVVLATACAVGTLPLQADTAAVIEALRTVSLATDKAVAIRDLRLNLGMAELLIEEGILIPTSRAGAARSPEIVFVGTGRFLLAAPDKIEAGQLEFFAGSHKWLTIICARHCARARSRTLKASSSTPWLPS